MTVTVRLNHTIIAAHDKEKSSLFLTGILGLPAPSLRGPFAVVQVSDETSLDYMDTDGEIVSQPYAFLVEEYEFDQIFRRIRDRHLPYWADPYRHKRDEINMWDGGRGVYFDDPSGPLAGDHHPSLRQRWYDDITTSPVVRAATGSRRSRGSPV
jgi:hypothetical protein